jgi:hypothetical protein
MCKMGNVPSPVLKLHAKNIRELGQTPDLDAWGKFMERDRAIPNTMEVFRACVERNHGTLPTVPCVALHPGHASCRQYGLYLWMKSYQRILPIHLSLNAVPVIVFKTASIFKQYISTYTRPFKVLKQIITGALQSALFFASYGIQV